jgi:hypothetical protein
MAPSQMDHLQMEGKSDISRLLFAVAEQFGPSANRFLGPSLARNRFQRGPCGWVDDKT